MRRLLIYSGFVALLIFIFTYLLKSNNKNSAHHINQDSLVTISISAVGDLMCHSPQANYAKENADSFNFNPTFESIKPYLEKSDFVFGNLETVVAGKSIGYSGYPLFNAPDDYIAALKFAGFNLLTTSNNHALDKGEKGLLRTISIINKNRINYVGTYSSERDRDSIRIFNIKGIRVAILSYSYGVNGNYIPKDHPYLINLIDTLLIKKDIKTARQQNADIVLVYFHFGEEYHRLPTDYQKFIVERTISYGADIIIGGHPHVIEPIAYFKTDGGKLDTGFVDYSLGNFVSNQRWRYSDAGLILNLFLTKNLTTNSIYISKVTYIPTWVYKGKIGTKNEFEILPINEKLSKNKFSFLSENDMEKAKQAFNDTKDILETYTNRISLEDTASINN
ncbi:MAG: CapA family protein [Bacteroidetes bacterium]|nr:CapA family protein [Bacteroidota bacterium]